jgi:hypothetical protein
VELILSAPARSAPAAVCLGTRLTYEYPLAWIAAWGLRPAWRQHLIRDLRCCRVARAGASDCEPDLAAGQLLRCRATRRRREIAHARGRVVDDLAEELDVRI